MWWRMKGEFETIHLFLYLLGVGDDFQRFQNAVGIWNVLNRFFKNLLKYEACTKKLNNFIYHRYFSLIPTPTYATWDHISPAFFICFQKNTMIYNHMLVHRSNKGVMRNIVAPHPPHSASTSCSWSRICSFPAISSLILHVSAERVYWSLKDRTLDYVG